MPLREFGGRAAGGALGLQHGNALTNAAGNITVVFAPAFGAVPDLVAVAFDAANNYYVVIRTLNALGFTAHVRRIATHSHVAFTTGANQPLNNPQYMPMTSGAGAGMGLWYEEGATANNLTCVTSAVAADAAAAAGVTVMWFAMT